MTFASLNDISAVAATLPYEKLRRDKERDRERSKKKKKPAFRQLLEKEAEEEFGRMGCFFEAKV